MPQQTIIQASFNSGEISPLLAGRVDIAKYASSCRVLRNFIPLVQGAAQKRGGLRYIGAAKYHDRRCILIPFRRSVTENYVLEFGDHYIRFWRDRGQVLESGVPYEIASPYGVAQLIAADGTKNIHYAQSGDTLYLACKDVPPQRLVKLAANSWTLSRFIPVGGPWDEPNTAQNLKIAASGVSGSVTLTANFDAFSPTDVGRTVRLEIESFESYEPWESDRQYAVVQLPGLFVRSDSKIYQYVGARDPGYPRSGTVYPQHTRGSAWDGHGIYIDEDGDKRACGLLWTYSNCGYGIATITAVGGVRSATATVQAKYPFPTGINTYRWTLGAWHGGVEYPCTVTFFRERLVWAGGNRVWMSKVGEYSSFEDKEYSEVTPECAITIVVASDQADNIRWLASGGSLFVGTDGGEFVISESAGTEALGPANVKLEPQTSKGSIGIQPARISNSTLFVHRSGRKLHELIYDFNSDSFTTPEVSVLAEHAVRPGVTEIAWEDDRSILWCVRKDGAVYGLTYDRVQEVTGWHGQFLGGGARAESLAVVDAPSGGSEDLYAMATLTISGQVRRYMTYLDAGYSIGESSIVDAFFLDFGKTVVSGTPVTVVPTLEHLEGRNVGVLVDGAVHPDKVVTGGKITLDFPGKVIQVGLKYAAVLETNNAEAGSASGTAQGANKAIKNVALRLLESSGGFVGPDAKHPQEIYSRTVDGAMDAPPPLFTGDTDFIFPSQFEKDGRVLVSHDSPLPFTLLALIITVDTKR